MRISLVPMVVLALAGGCSKSSDAPPAVAAVAKPAPAGSAVAGVGLPPPGSFQVDATHSSILFKARHMNAGYIYGWFKDFSGTFAIDADPAKSHVELTVNAASIDTRDDERNDHLTGPDFLNVKQFPEITFKSTSVAAAPGGWRVTGDLTIHGVTKSIAFTATPVGDAKDPQGKRIVGIEAQFPIKRADFGVSFMPEIVGPELELIIAIEGAAA